MVWFSQFGRSTSPAHTTPWAVHRPGQMVSCFACLDCSASLHCRMLVCCSFLSFFLPSFCLCDLLVVCLKMFCTCLKWSWLKHYTHIQYFGHVISLFYSYTVESSVVCLICFIWSTLNWELTFIEYMQRNSTYSAEDRQVLIAMKIFYMSLTELHSGHWLLRFSRL